MTAAWCLVPSNEDVRHMCLLEECPDLLQLVFICCCQAWAAPMSLYQFEKRHGSSESRRCKLICQAAWGLFMFILGQNSKESRCDKRAKKQEHHALKGSFSIEVIAVWSQQYAICNDTVWYRVKLWYTTYIAPDNVKISELQALLSSALAMSMAWASNTSSSPCILHQTISCRPGPSSSCLYPRPEGARWLFRAGNEDFQQLHHQQWRRTPKAAACMRNINLSCLALCMVKACRILSA